MLLIEIFKTIYSLNNNMWIKEKKRNLGITQITILVSNKRKILNIVVH